MAKIRLIWITRSPQEQLEMTVSLLVLEVNQVQICLAAWEDPNQVLMAWELSHSKAHGPGCFLQNMEMRPTWTQNLIGRLKSHLYPFGSYVKSGLLQICTWGSYYELRRVFWENYMKHPTWQQVVWSQTWLLSRPTPLLVPLSALWLLDTASAQHQLLLRNRRALKVQCWFRSPQEKRAVERVPPKQRQSASFPQCIHPCVSPVVDLACGIKAFIGINKN